ncbi:hypothetical protein ACH5RR_040398 [Cinchona calisaya]|uniref:Uncharacterized protein n=1 Tax=Cinchona calisaya TaxID=153742 RepID=A0ABD2XTH5_9GENT
MISQNGYAVDYVTQGGFLGIFLNQNSQPGYSHFGPRAPVSKIVVLLGDYEVVIEIDCENIMLILSCSILKDYMAHGSQDLFTQAGFNDPTHDDASQNHFGVANTNPL